jgi:hypothetical protein
MSRSMKLGIVAIIAVFVASLMVTDDAEARHRRRARHRRGGCAGYSSCCGYNPCYGAAPVSSCGACATPSCQTGACGVATGNCPGGVCAVGSGAYSGGYNAGYGSSVQGYNSTIPQAPGITNGQGGFDQAPPPAPNGNTFREDQRGSADGARSPSDRSDDRPAAPAESGAAPAGGERAAPPPPPQEQ